MEDGSGLSHFNAISSAQFTSVLSYMCHSGKNKDVFLNSLASIGDGTLSGFNKSDFPGSALKAKSGSMTRVRCYSGYLTTSSGKKLAFSFMINHFDGTPKKLNAWIENLWLDLWASY